jgi:hypothetical protein
MPGAPEVLPLAAEGAAAPPPCAAATGGTTTVCGLLAGAAVRADEAFAALAAG